MDRSANITRRDAVIGSGIALAAMPLRALGAEPAGDAELLALGVDFDRLAAAEYEILAGDKSEDLAAWRVARETTRPVAERIEATPATTAKGVQLKARVLAWCHEGKFETNVETMDGRLMGDIVRELQALVG